MTSKPYVELSIERRKSQYFVLIVDDHEINQVGPLTKRQALKLHYALANTALKHGGRTQPIRKPKINTDAQNAKAKSQKPVVDYPLSEELRNFISQ